MPNILALKLPESIKLYNTLFLFGCTLFAELRGRNTQALPRIFRFVLPLDCTREQSNERSGTRLKTERR